MSERTRLSELTPPDQSQMNAEQVIKAGQSLLDHFNVQANPNNPSETEQFVTAMDQLNPRFQGGRDLVRYQLELDQTEWPGDTKQIIMDSAKAMRMLESQTPFEGSFDVMLVLAGARQANMDRMRYAARCCFTRASLSVTIDSRSFREGVLIFVGSKRKLTDDEKDNTSNYAPGAVTEEDLIVATMEHFDSEQRKLTNEFGKYPQINRWDHVITDKDKAGTVDVVDKVLSEIANYVASTGRELPKDFRLGAVTTQIYQSATELDLARVAKRYGITETFTAGNPSNPNIIAKRTVATYLSEVLRTLKAAALAKSEGVDRVGLSEYPIRPYGLGEYFI